MPLAHQDMWDQQRLQRDHASLEGVAYPYYNYHRLCPACDGEGGFRGRTNDFIECAACEATGRQNQKSWMRCQIALYRSEMTGLQMEIMDAEHSQPPNDPFASECRDRLAFVDSRIKALSAELEALS